MPVEWEDTMANTALTHLRTRNHALSDRLISWASLWESKLAVCFLFSLYFLQVKARMLTFYSEFAEIVTHHILMTKFEN